MALTKDQKQDIIAKFGGDTKNTGSTEVQIALMTERIRDLTEHFKLNPKDHNSRRGLLQLVGKRRRLLRYYKRINLNGYRELIAKLELRK
ncbi:MAG: 30S ribosomal protein S15 [Spirochaetia bacterium]|nr:30S ribosomal protein S15 [Spirochaetia bacterium]